ncbi:hypothetical protein KEM56_006597 [Ascosphaera pollenicola]|nr:hypothetical protein KEM56_006597 [Ascosphaera pollenicola]
MVVNIQIGPASSRNQRQGSSEQPTLTSSPLVNPSNVGLPVGQIAWQTKAPTGESIRQHPWLRQIRSALHYDAHAFGRLQQELLTYYQYMKQSHQEKQARIVTGEYIKDIFAQAPGLASQVSINPIIDVAVPHSPLVFFSKIHAPHGVAPEANRRRNFVRSLRLQAIENALYAMNTSTNPRSDVFVRDETVSEGPDSECLTVRHVPTGMQVIVHADRWNEQPKRAEVVERYRLRYPYLEPIYVALRTLLEINGLFSDGFSRTPTDENQVERRTLDPYTLMLLIVGALRQSKHGVSYRNNDYGSPFLDVLHFVATWDMTTHGMIVKDPAMFRFGSYSDPFRPGLRNQMAINLNTVKRDGQRHLCIQDVIDGWRNVGARITTAGEIQDLFRVTYLDVSSQMGQWQSSSKITGENGKLVDRPVLLRALGANYKSLRAWRAGLVRGSNTLQSYFRSKKHAVQGKEREVIRPARRKEWWRVSKRREKEYDDEYDDE